MLTQKNKKDVKLEDMFVERPTKEGLKEAYETLQKKFSETETPKERYDLLLEWDKVRANFMTWSHLINFRFTQDTRNEEVKKEREFADELGPIVQGYDVAMKRQYLTNGQDVEHYTGKHLFKLWESDVTGFRKEIEEDAVKEAKRSADYVELCSSAEIPFDGKTYNLSEIHRYKVDPDRSVREKANRAVWEFFEKNGEAFDEIYDDLVKIRTEKARKLGFDNFLPLGYLEMQRVDYGAKDVENYRRQIREHVVPLCSQLKEIQKERLGVSELKVWDGDIFSLKGNPRPLGGVEEIVESGIKMFDELDPELGKFFRMMKERNLLDLDARKGKAGGGYCNSFPNYEVPVVFANFNGTKGDVEVITHEIGHAFQYYQSAKKVPVDYQWPTYESCEIHSMSLEFLTWPYMELFFGDDAERFREIHLIGSLLFLPYGCAVDHFQHLVYENPDASPQERHEFWKEMEELYLPELDWGGIPYGEKGGRWQLQAHIYSMPFYYIDYTLAQVCAFQYLEWYEKDKKAALDSYIKLCKRGGEDSFQRLVESAGLRSPFEEGCLEHVVKFCRKSLKLDS